MDLLNLMEKRHSVRAYSNKKVSQEMIDRIVKAGVLAPTACNFQPVKIVVIESDKSLEKLSSAA
ncbi:nitroreductase family protein, partial [Succinivibrio sp.]